MALDPGTGIGPYKVTEKIGAGGMGEVWRAHDPSLKRDVAIKILPGSFAADSDRLARFQREAEILASLNHPNIATIFGLEKDDDRTVIVMEFVDGPTLADLITQAPIQPDEALGIAHQIVDALEAAHARQIVHRDLKPANVKVRNDGTVKVLDFGISKPIDPRAISGGTPVMTTPAITQAGLILGTAAYMSPEQARGQFVDQRTDIWAFGCLLFEMLTGQPAFGGEDVMLTLARVLDRDTDLSSIPSTISPAVRHTLKLCLEKDPRKRIADIRDVRLALEGRFESTSGMTVEGAGVRRPVWRRLVPAVSVALAAGLIVGVTDRFFMQGVANPLQSAAVRRYPMDLGPTERIVGGLNVNLAISPDGQRLAYIIVEQEGISTGGEFSYFIRDMQQLEPRDLNINSRGLFTDLFFSPDGNSLGLLSFLDQELRRIPVEGGMPQVLTDGPVANVEERVSLEFTTGGTWLNGGQIIYSALSDETRNLYRVPASGGTAEVVAAAPVGRDYVWPRAVSEGHAILFVNKPSDEDTSEGSIDVLDLETEEVRTLIRQAYNPRYSPTGHIVFARNGALWAARFDPIKLELAGPEMLVLNGVQMDPELGTAAYTFSENGMLVYLPGEVLGMDEAFQTLRANFVWVDHDGMETSLGFPPRLNGQPRLAPDEERLAVTLARGEDSSDVWIFDLTDQTEMRLTFETAGSHYPLWTADGSRIVFSSSRDGEKGLFWQSADGTGEAERLTTGLHVAKAVSADGRLLIYQESANDWDEPDGDLLVLSLEDPPSSEPLLADVQDAALSSDGRWLAYEIRPEVSASPGIFVRPFPNVGGGLWQVSDGGTEPRWGRDGLELYYRSGDQLMSAAVAFEPSFSVARVTDVFSGDYLNFYRASYDASNDGQRFLMLKAEGGSSLVLEQTRLIIVENWFTELERLAPALQ